MWRDEANLLDMLIWARHAQEFVAGLSEEEFLGSRMIQSATTRAVEVVGEAAGRVSPEYCESHPEIPWAGIIGMRNRLAHEYDRLDLAELWRAATRDCPELIALVERLVPEGSRGVPDEWEFL